MLTNLLLAIGVTLLLFLLYRSIRGNPDAFSGKNISKSLTTLGFLALILIAFVAFAVMLLK